MSNIPRKASTASNNTPKKVVSEGKNVGKKRDVEESKAKPRGGRGMYLKDETVPVKEGLSRTGEKWSPAKEGWKQESGDLKISDKGKEEEKSVKRPEKVVGRKRAMEGGKDLPIPKKVESKKSEKELRGKEAKSLFKMRDMSGEIGKKLANEKDRASIMSLDRASAELRPSADKRRLVLTAMDLIDPASEKMDFAQKGDYSMIKIKMEAENAEIFIDFIKNTENESLLSRIEVIEFGDINLENVKRFQEVLDALGEKRDRVKSLSTFICGNFGNCEGDWNMAFNFPEGLNIRNMIWGAIACEITCRFPESLSQLSCGDIHFLYYGSREGYGSIKSLEILENLSTFSCGSIGIECEFSIPEEFVNLKFFSCLGVEERAQIEVPSELKHLNSFKCGLLKFRSSIIFPKKLTTLKTFVCGDVDWARIDFPKSLNRLAVFEFGEVIGSIPFRKKLEGIRADIAIKGKESEKKEM